MSEVRIGGCASGEISRKSADAAALGAADWLSLAAAPTFAIMALMTATQRCGPADVLCSSVHGPSLLNGMTLMYALMSVFHAVPWVRLVSKRWR